MKVACLIFLGLSLVFFLAPGTESRACPPTAGELYPAIDVTTWPDAPFRWKDIATNLYALTYQESYLYEDAMAVVVYDSCAGEAFSGHFSGSNLKPNFAYQMKLVGKPTAIWGEEGDDIANENLGYTGRWWRAAPNPGNSSDADYEANHHLDGYIYEGYLLFDFFLSDPTGQIEVDFSIDSSFHVLWWAHQRTPQPCDSPAKWATVEGYAADPAYDADVGPTEVGVFAEIERACTGTSTLPLGVYHCRFLLTEESFHQSGDEEGDRASALVNDDVVFEISDLTGIGPSDQGLGLAFASMQPNPSHGLSFLNFRLPESSSVDLSIYDLTGRQVHRHVAGDLAVGDHTLQWDGHDLQGQPVAAGVYVYKVEVQGMARRVGTFVLLK